MFFFRNSLQALATSFCHVLELSLANGVKVFFTRVSSLSFLRPPLSCRSFPQPGILAFCYITCFKKVYNSMYNCYKYENRIWYMLKSKYNRNAIIGKWSEGRQVQGIRLSILGDKILLNEKIKYFCPTDITLVFQWILTVGVSLLQLTAFWHDHSRCSRGIPFPRGYC